MDRYRQLQFLIKLSERLDERLTGFGVSDWIEDLRDRSNQYVMDDALDQIEAGKMRRGGAQAAGTVKRKVKNMVGSGKASRDIGEALKVNMRRNPGPWLSGAAALGLGAIGTAMIAHNLRKKRRNDVRNRRRNEFARGDAIDYHIWKYGEQGEDLTPRDVRRHEAIRRTAAGSNPIRRANLAKVMRKGKLEGERIQGEILGRMQERFGGTVRGGTLEFPVRRANLLQRAVRLLRRR